MELIVSHINTDFDAFSSMVAAKKLYPEAVFAFPGAQEKKLRDFIAEMYPIEQVKLKDIDPSKLIRVIIVDTKSPMRLGPLAQVIAASSADIIIYDHHEHEQGDLEGKQNIIEPVGATATIFIELFRAQGIRPTPIEASTLALGIYEETGNLLYPSTTERDLAAASWLLKCGASLRIVSTYLRTAMSAEEISLLNKLTGSAREVVIEGLSVTVASASSDKYIGDAAHLAHRVMDAGYTDAVVILLEMEGKVILVGRSRTPEINIANVLEAFGGGGHPTAAAATVREKPLKLLEESVLEEMKSAVKPGRFALDVMTSPVITIDNNATIKEAEQKLTRYEVNVLPVVDESLNYLGIISREVVEKAIHHGLAGRQAMDFTTTDAITVDRYTPVAELERQMIEQNQRFVPVLDNTRIKGAITRTDLLRAMYDANLQRLGLEKSRSGQPRQAIEKNLSSLIRSRLDTSLVDILLMAGRTAGQMGFTAYLVGGTVRDILRNREAGETVEGPDIDIVVEGDGVAFSRELGKALGARVHVHERFHTATLVSDSIKLDIATARTEYYESPAALPTVEMSSIKKDLYRRDFTINTLCVKLSPGKFGKLVDFFGAQRDIKERRIKVLHNLSFIEDPTRAFRAVRFAGRFGFRISRHTENLIRSALKMELFDKLTGTRLYDEMALIFQESEPTGAMEKLGDYGLLKVIHPALSFDEAMQEMLTSVDSTLSWFGLLFTEEPVDQPVIYLSALLSGLKDADKLQALERLAVPDKVKRSVMDATIKARGALRKLKVDDPADVYETLAELSLESVLLAMAVTKYEDRKREVSRYLLEYRTVKPELSGDDLKKLGIKPGPVYSSILKELRNLKLTGKTSSRQDEEAFVLARMEQA